MAERNAGGGRRRMGLAAMTLLGLAVGCSGLSLNGPGTVSRGAWKASYLSARDALESGRPEAAARDYARIVDQSGPVGSRVRLEYAHALLRAGAYAAAAEQARGAAAGQDGLGAAAARAVEAVAEHEGARAALASGRADGAVAARLAAAGATLDAALAAGDGIDPEGVLAARRTEIAADETRLRQLGL